MQERSFPYTKAIGFQDNSERFNDTLRDSEATREIPRLSQKHPTPNRLGLKTQTWSPQPSQYSAPKSPKFPIVTPIIIIVEKKKENSPSTDHSSKPSGVKFTSRRTLLPPRAPPESSSRRRGRFIRIRTWTLLHTGTPPIAAGRGRARLTRRGDICILVYMQQRGSRWCTFLALGRERTPAREAIPARRRRRRRRHLARNPQRAAGAGAGTFSRLLSAPAPAPSACTRS